VIEGLEAALVGMRAGGKRRILVPPEAGYVSK
jgi:FKBP-type peptidyl-prolyl cis-trans isomerase